MSAGDTTSALDSENARQEVAQMLATKRAGPDGQIVRKQYWFWSVLDDLNLYTGDTYRVIAAVRRIVEDVLPADALSGLGSIQARRGMVRTDKKVVFGKPMGIFEIGLQAKDMGGMSSHVTKLGAAGLKVMHPEDDFEEQSCSHILVPKMGCIQPLYRKLVDPQAGGVTKLCYAMGGGAQGQEDNKARLIVDVTPGELCRKMPELVTLEQGSHVIACELAPEDGQVERWPMMAGSGRVAGKGRLRFSLLSPGLSRQSFGPDSPMREWIAELFSCAVEEVRPQFLSEEKGWKDAAFDVAVPEKEEGKLVKARLIRASRGGWFIPDIGEEFGQYKDCVAPSILFAADRVQLAQLEGAKAYVMDAATLSSEQAEQLGELSRMLGGLAEGAAKDRTAALRSSEALKDAHTQGMEQLTTTLEELRTNQTALQAVVGQQAELLDEAARRTAAGEALGMAATQTATTVAGALGVLLLRSSSLFS